MKQAKWFLLLHVILGVYAGSSVCSKLAAQQPFLSAAFIVLYEMCIRDRSWCSSFWILPTPAGSFWSASSSVWN